MPRADRRCDGDSRSGAQVQRYHPRMSDLHAMRLLVQQQQNGVLCTAHHALAGWPFGSVVPYALASDGDPLVFLSDIAEHTHNLRTDGRASLFVADPAAAQKPQAGARVTLLARAVLPDDAARTTAEDCYFARFPAARAMRQAHGFQVWRLEIDAVRWIGGFGSMGWFDRAAWTGAPDPLAKAADDIVAHMNDDHRAAILELVHHVCPSAAATKATLTSVDRGGFTALAHDPTGAERTVRIPFLEVCATPDAVRRASIALLQVARRHRDGIASPRQ